MRDELTKIAERVLLSNEGLTIADREAERAAIAAKLRARADRSATCKDGLQVDVATTPEKYDDNVWPPTIWLAGESYAKTRTSSRDPNAVAYVRADDYNELLEWSKRRIIEDELCPCEKPNLPETPESSASDGAQGVKS